jgi:hypothetical protein
MQPLWVGRKAAANMLGLSIRGVDYLIARGELLSRLCGRRRLIPLTALQDFAKKDHPSPITDGETSRVQRSEGRDDKRAYSRKP